MIDASPVNAPAALKPSVVPPPSAMRGPAHPNVGMSLHVIPPLAVKNTHWKAHVSMAWPVTFRTCA